jgi:hypothetical protein
MKSSREKFPASGEQTIPKTSERRKTGPQETGVFKKFGKEDAYAPDVEEAIQQLKDMFSNREFLLAELLKSRNSGDYNATNKIAEDLEKTEEFIRVFSEELAENIDIEKHNLQHLHEWLDSDKNKQH